MCVFPYICMYLVCKQRSEIHILLRSRLSPTAMKFHTSLPKSSIPINWVSVGNYETALEVFQRKIYCKKYEDCFFINGQDIQLIVFGERRRNDIKKRILEVIKSEGFWKLFINTSPF